MKDFSNQNRKLAIAIFLTCFYMALSSSATLAGSVKVLNCSGKDIVQLYYYNGGDTVKVAPKGKLNVDKGCYADFACNFDDKGRCKLLKFKANGPIVNTSTATWAIQNKKLNVLFRASVDGSKRDSVQVVRFDEDDFSFEGGKSNSATCDHLRGVYYASKGLDADKVYNKSDTRGPDEWYFSRTNLNLKYDVRQNGYEKHYVGWDHGPEDFCEQ